MWFRLARQLGMSVRRAQEEISSTEFMEWIAYERLDPGDPERGDFRTANICFWIHRQYLSRPDQKKQKIQDYLIDFDTHKEELDDIEQGKQNTANLMAMLGKVQKNG